MHYLQQKILQLADSYDLSHMTLRQIGKLIGEEQYPQKVKHHLQQLERKGFINLDSASKSVKRVHSDAMLSVLMAIPILGSANCGEASLYAEENIEGYLRISKRLLPKKDKLFALKAVGNSMNKAKIQGKAIDEGDYVIIDSEDRAATNGDYVVSVIDGFANIKKFMLDPDNACIVLISESSSDHPPIYIHPDDMDAYMINGKVIEVIKKPKIS